MDFNFNLITLLIALAINLTICQGKSISGSPVNELNEGQAESQDFPQEIPELDFQDNKETAAKSEIQGRGLLDIFSSNSISPSNSYVPHNTYAVNTVKGSGTEEDPCDYQTSYITQGRKDSLGAQAAKAFHLGSNVPFSILGNLGDSISGQKGAVSKDAAFTDTIFTSAQDLVSTAGGGLLDAVGDVTGLGGVLKQMGAGTMVGQVGGILGGGIASALKAPQDGIKALAAAGGLGNIFGMKGRPQTGQSTVTFRDPKHPCQVAGSITQLNPQRITAGSYKN